METPATGALPSAPDYRDAYATASAVAPVADFALPASLPKQYLGGVMMQAQEPDCVLFSVVYCMKVYWFLKTGKWIDFSPRFLAIMVKRIDGQDRATAGTFPRLAFKIAAQYGCCTTKLLPNDTTLPVLAYRQDSLITQAMLDEAAPYKIPGYIQAPVDFVKTREYLYLYKAVSTLFQIGNEMWLPSWDKTSIDPLRTPATIVSGHQMTQVGYPDATYNDIENQWSEEWADGGDNKINYKAWMPFIMEQWVIAEVPTDVAAFLKTLPSPANFHYQWGATLVAGMTPNDSVKMFQVALMILGFLAPVAPDELGIFGPKTAAANGKLQASIGITAIAPNNVGPLTRAFLNKTFSV